MKYIFWIFLLIPICVRAATYSTGVPLPPISISGSGGAITVTTTGKTPFYQVQNNYVNNPVTPNSYTHIVNSLPSSASIIEVFDSSGQTLYLAFGGSGSESNQIYIFPGGNGQIPMNVAQGTNLSIKAVSITASAGELDINFYK